MVFYPRAATNSALIEGRGGSLPGQTQEGSLPSKQEGDAPKQPQATNVLTNQASGLPAQQPASALPTQSQTGENQGQLSKQSSQVPASLSSTSPSATGAGVTVSVTTLGVSVKDLISSTATSFWASTGSTVELGNGVPIGNQNQGDDYGEGEPDETANNQNMLNSNDDFFESEQDNNYGYFEKPDGSATGVRFRKPGLAVKLQPEEDRPKSHFIAYFFTVVILCIVGYIVFHNKQKIIAFVVEGRNTKTRRPNSKDYSRLESNVSEVLPEGEKPPPGGYVY
ncbi:trans-Golgi network integral membrane protein 1 [Lingula anatina]|uniref:Trans-Golgi network integral membrane protein 1 n=1 Tax=Lingula anatina TaxID=7574 RepID=A0A1S3ITI9_LINAN|nr:trans-Golgi network integral membrane protein 1 [Lingula anatina]|eukprot:XP_013401525.1 trans-Golgi network integral membrane protein 1 [Lingula anatina]